jgi:hypothetical protein
MTVPGHEIFSYLLRNHRAPNQWRSLKYEDTLTRLDNALPGNVSICTLPKL